MSKKLLVLFASAVALSITGMTYAGELNSAHLFTDSLIVKFVGFPNGDEFLNQYIDNNGINITGAAFFNTNAPATVLISSTNLVEWGVPSISMKYAANFGPQKCVVSFRDGPGIPLTYQNFSAPTCPGITLSSIQMTGRNTYSLTITDSEP